MRAASVLRPLTTDSRPRPSLPGVAEEDVGDGAYAGLGPLDGHRGGGGVQVIMSEKSSKELHLCSPWFYFAVRCSAHLGNMQYSRRVLIADCCLLDSELAEQQRQGGSEEVGGLYSVLERRNGERIVSTISNRLELVGVAACCQLK
jgi:hypothetical protein